MAECSACESFVSMDFVRVFGDNDREVHGCPQCMTATGIVNGDATHGSERAHSK